jgi:putative transposase
MMKRSNTFILLPNNKQEQQLTDLATNCAKLWNEITFRRRQSFFEHKMNWNTSDLYKKYSRLIGSASAQQIIRKNDEAWRSFFALLKMQGEGKLPDHQQGKVRPVGYWKDGQTGRYRLYIPLRNDCYKIHNNRLQIRKDLRIRMQGNRRWYGKQGRMEIHYTENKWRVYQAVSKLQPSQKPKGNKTAYVDLGVVNLATVYVDGWRQPLAYSGKALLNQWWADCRHIGEHQSMLKRCNGRDYSERLSRMYLKRKRRFRHAVNAMVRQMVQKIHGSGVSRIDLGNLTGIREGKSTTARTNSMIHNFWSFDYVIRRIKEVADEYGIKVRQVSEYRTSSICPKCRSTNTSKRKRLFICNACGLEAHRDAVGVMNIASLQGEKVNRVMIHPLLSRWDSQGMNIWRARISSL